MTVFAPLYAEALRQVGIRSEPAVSGFVPPGYVDADQLRAYMKKVGRGNQALHLDVITAEANRGMTEIWVCRR